MASTISTTPAATNINVVATAAEYSQKGDNLKEPFGSFLPLATILVYDDIIRAQGVKLTHGLTQAEYDLLKEPLIAAQFAGNVQWFMDELVGMESDWDKYASPGIFGNTAYSYVQFNIITIPYAIRLYESHLKRFNDRKDIDRGWKPYGYSSGETMYTPSWLKRLKIDNRGSTIARGTYKTALDRLSYDEQMALALIHMHELTSKDINFIKIGRGEVDAAKTMYLEHHYKKTPTQETLNRLNITDGGFFKIHYVKAASLKQKIMEHTPAGVIATALLDEIKTSRYAGVINKIKSWFRFWD
jgi:hypothetical protein